MEGYQERVVQEKQDLYGKVERLNGFIEDSPVFKTLPQDEQLLLVRQLKHMRGYLVVLGDRIALF